MDERNLTAEERSHLGYTRQRLGGCQSVLLDSRRLPLNARVERAYVEGFMATLTDWVGLAGADLAEEWEAIREEFTRHGRINITVGLMGDSELEAFEARILAFIDRYMAETELRRRPPGARPG